MAVGWRWRWLIIREFWSSTRLVKGERERKWNLIRSFMQCSTLPSECVSLAQCVCECVCAHLSAGKLAMVMKFCRTFLRLASIWANGVTMSSSWCLQIKSKNELQWMTERCVWSSVNGGKGLVVVVVAGDLKLNWNLGAKMAAWNTRWENGVKDGKTVRPLDTES